MVNLYELESKIKNLNSLKGENRQKEIKNISLSLINYCKAINKPSFDKDFLNSLFSVEDNDRTRQRINKAIVSFLLSENKISLSEKTNKNIYFRVAPLSSLDHDSYSVLMTTNGYYRNFFYFVGLKRVYLKKYAPLNLDRRDFINGLDFEKLPEDFNINKIYSEIASFKGEKFQKCLVMNNLSIKKKPQYTKSKVYLIL